jgi:hypothetical protein
MEMARKATDTAAQMRKADVEQQKREQGSLQVGDHEENTPSASELIKDHPEIFGKEEGEPGKAEDKTPQERQLSGNIGLTADQKHAAMNDGTPLNKAAKVEGKEIALGDRVILTTATPIGGQTDNAAHVIGFNPINGLPNLRLEHLDGGQGRPQEFGGVPYGAPNEERGPFFRWAEDFAKKSNDKAEDKA